MKPSRWSRVAINLSVVAIIVIWTVPTLGLFITSFRTKDNISSSGWWTVFTNPQGELTLDNYQKVLIDEKLGEIVGFWKQIANKSDGTKDEIYGIGGSWFRLNTDKLIEWQRDFFDFGHVQAHPVQRRHVRRGEGRAGVQP